MTRWHRDREDPWAEAARDAFGDTPAPAAPPTPEAGGPLPGPTPPGAATMPAGPAADREPLGSSGKGKKDKKKKDKDKAAKAAKRDKPPKPPKPAKGPEPSAPPADAEADAAPRRPPLTLPWPPLVHAEAGFSLRPWGGAPTDADVLTAAWNDPEIARWTKVPNVTDRDAAGLWIRGEERRREGGMALDLVIAELDNPAHVLGEIGFVVVEPDRLWAELGFWLAPDARGRGIATAAVRGFTEWVMRDLPIRRLFAQIQPENPRSAGVVDRAGYTAAGTLDHGPQVWVRDP